MSINFWYYFYYRYIQNYEKMNLYVVLVYKNLKYKRHDYYNTVSFLYEKESLFQTGIFNKPTCLAEAIIR